MKTSYKILMIKIPVSDMDKAKDFYTDKLGFEVTKVVGLFRFSRQSHAPNARASNDLACPNEI
jgi:catechol 2,3-dioxygenase-like lactoylglutathione lyase family enzyme